MWHLNIWGLRTKWDLLRTFIHNAVQKPDIIGIWESHLPPHEEYGIPPDIKGFNAYYNNLAGDAGGTWIYIKNYIRAEEITVQTTRELQHRITMI